MKIKPSDLEGFESVSLLSKRAQYRVTQRPVAYSVVGGLHNSGGKTCHFRFRVDLTESLGWKLGDCVEVQLNRSNGQVAIFKSEERGYKLVATSKRNGIASYRVGIRWNEDFGFPNVYSQVGCDVVNEIEGGMIIRIRTEDDVKPSSDVASYKDPTKIDDSGLGLTPRTLTHGFNNQRSIKDIRSEMEVDEKLKRGEIAEARLDRIKKIVQKSRRKASTVEGKE